MAHFGGDAVADDIITHFNFELAEQGPSTRVATYVDTKRSIHQNTARPPQA